MNPLNRAEEDRAKLLNHICTYKDLVLPPPDLNPIEWCEKHIRLQDGPSAGKLIKFKSYQRDMLLAISDNSVSTIVFMTSAQIAKTTILNCALFYWIATDPCNICIGQATGKELKSWKNSRIDPVLQDCPELSKYVPPKNDKNSINNFEQTRLTTGHNLFYISLTAPSQLRGKTVKRIVLDEIAGADETDEGNPVQLAKQRTAAFNGIGTKILLSSTPVYTGDLIDIEYTSSDQRKFFVPCPHCDEFQVLDWNNVKFDWQPLPGNVPGEIEKKIPVPESARYVCPHCSGHWTEIQRARAVNRGEWRATNQQAPQHKIGFHINRLYSETELTKIVQEFSDCYRTGKLKTFYNTALGLPFDDQYHKAIDPSDLDQYRDRSLSVSSIPDAVISLRAGVDVQKDRLEVSLVGIDADERLYVLDHKKFYSPCGDVSVHTCTAWDELDMYLQREYKTLSHNVLRVGLACIDSGYQAELVYKQCAKRHARGWRATKGSSTWDAPSTPVGGRARDIDGYQLYILGVTQLKQRVYSILYDAVENPDESMIRFSVNLPSDYFQQLTAEKQNAAGRFTKIRSRNETLDTLVYAVAAFELLKVRFDRYKTINNESTPEQVQIQTVPVEVVNTETAIEKPQQPEQPKVPVHRLRKKPGGGWCTNW